MREGVMSLEIECKCDIVWCGGGGDFSPEEKLVRICQLRKPNECKF